MTKIKEQEKSTPRGRLFGNVIPRIAEHDRETGHIWRNSGKLCHDCNHLKTLYIENLALVREDELISRGSSSDQALKMVSREDAFNEEHKRHLSD